MYKCLDVKWSEVFEKKVQIARGRQIVRNTAVYGMRGDASIMIVKFVSYVRHYVSATMAIFFSDIVVFVCPQSIFEI